MMSSGSTRFFFDFDIFSIEPIWAGLPVAISMARRAVAVAFEADLGRQQPAARRRLVGLVRDHALREERRERLAQVLRHVPGVGHGAIEEARIEEMQDRVLDAADVLIDGQPVGRGLLVDRASWRRAR